MSATTQQPQQLAMTPIPLASESGELDITQETAEKLINLYVEEAPQGARSKFFLRSTPGLVPWLQLGPGPIRAINADYPGYAYLVSGTHLWMITPYIVVDMGDVGTPTATDYYPMVTIAMGPAQVVVCVPPNAFAANLGSTTFHQITGTTDNPFAGASTVTYIDGYFVFTGTGNDSRFFCTELFDPDTVDALDFAYADATPNVVRRVVTHLDRLWFMGDAGVEIWWNSGDQNFPFQRDAGGFIPRTVRSNRSVVVCDGSVFWLGQDGIIYRTNGYSAVRVSTHAIEAAIRQYDPTNNSAGSVADALAYSDDGHTFYAISFVKGDDPGRTFVYDCATKRWHERSSAVDGNGRWRACASVLSNVLHGPSAMPNAGSVVMGDAYSGAILVLLPDGGSDNGVQTPRIAITPPIWADTDRGYMHRLEVGIELQTPSNVVLSWSDDGGGTWKGNRQLGLNGTRAVATRLGSFRERSIKITANERVRIYDLNAMLSKGNGG